MNESVFVSCVSQEFRTTRGLVSNTLRRLGFTPIDQEIFGTESGDLCQVLREKIDGCEGLIHLVGHGYGAEPPVETEFGRVSYTQYEFLYARSRGKKTWLVIVDESCPRDTPIIELDLPPEASHADPSGYQEERRRLQEDYRAKRQGDGHLFHRVSSEEQLQIKLNELRNELDTLREKQRQLQEEIARQLARIARRQRKQQRKEETAPKSIAELNPWLAASPRENPPEPRHEDAPPSDPKPAGWRRGARLVIGFLVLFAAVLFAGFWQLRYGFLARDIEAVKRGMLVEFVCLGAGLGCLVNLVVRLAMPPWKWDDLVLALVLGAALGWGASKYAASALPGEPEAFARQAHSALVDLGLARLIPTAADPVPAGTLLRCVEEDWKAGYYIDGQGVLRWPSLLHPRGWGSIDLRDRKTTAVHRTSWLRPANVAVGLEDPKFSGTFEEWLGMSVFSQDCATDQDAARLLAGLKAAAPALGVHDHHQPFGSPLWSGLFWTLFVFLAMLAGTLAYVLWRVVQRRTSKADQGRPASRAAKEQAKSRSGPTSPTDV